MNGKIENLLKQSSLSEGESSVSFAEKSFIDEAESARIFSLLKAKLLTIDAWNEHAMLSEYRLFDEDGQSLQSGKLFVGAFIQIALKSSGKYDWVRIVEIFDAPYEFVVTVQPTYDPTAETVDKTVISHFFTDQATNNFCLSNRRETISIYVIGLNEKSNTDETKNLLETIRNAAVNVGSYLGVQKGEWTKFCRHFLENVSVNKSE